MLADWLPAAIASVLLMGLSKSGFANGFGAFATPLMALAMPITQAAAVMLKDFGVPFEARVVSAHRTPDLLFEYAGSARDRGLKVTWIRVEAAVDFIEECAELAENHRRGPVPDRP